MELANQLSVPDLDPRAKAGWPPQRQQKRISMDPLTAARIQTVRDHMRLECEGDWDGVIATFAHPRYELYGAGTVFDGEAAVRGYFAASRIPFPDQANEIIAIGAEGDAVLVEFWLTGTHLGPLRTPKGEIAPTGKAFRVRMMASFEFTPGSAKIICERPYFDRRAVITALGLD
jgi:predicted ester cyclase